MLSFMPMLLRGSLIILDGEARTMLAGAVAPTEASGVALTGL
jgi:hypothetical protein